MNGLDPMVAYNMPTGASAGAGGASGMGPMSKASLIAIALDMLGQNIDPENPMAGIGSYLGKSAIASQAEAASQKRSDDTFRQLLEAMTPADKEGPTSVTTSLGKDGRSRDYTIKGLAGIEDPTRMPGVKTPGIFTDKDFEEKFGGF
jgi:hypothetical protein